MLGMANMQVGLLLVFFFQKFKNGQFKNVRFEKSWMKSTLKIPQIGFYCIML
jgi:hypothetical protein